jgi:hypothetical protein
MWWQKIETSLAAVCRSRSTSLICKDYREISREKYKQDNEEKGGEGKERDCNIERGSQKQG